ncbi:MAG TPA: gliding motility-associated C-terminal domain-containing protein [Bacteroidales bacterium]|nr:gliding motility-associated C-terminal domain-containing protein [Bacteroidales bacterium]
MKKSIILIFLTILGLTANSQTASIQTLTGAIPGNSCTVDITLNNFSPNNISSFQYTVRYDTNYLKYIATTNWASGVSGVTIQVVNFGSINAIRFNWVGTPVVIDGLLCKLNFLYKLPESGCHSVTWSDDPLPRIFKDGSSVDYMVTYVDGQVCPCTAVSIGIQPSSVSICASYESGTLSVPLTNGDVPFTYQWQYYNGSTWANVVGGTPTGAIYINATTKDMIISQVSAAGSYQYRCYVTNCSGANNTVTNPVILTVKDRPAAPQVGTITPPTCSVSTGSVVLSGLPSGNWQLTRSPGGNTLGSGSTTTVTGIPSSTYTFTVTDLNPSSLCTSVPSAPVVINVQPPTPATISLGTPVQPTCTDTTGHITVSNLPSVGTWTLTSNPAGISINGTGTSVTVNGIPAGHTYTFTVNNGYCSSAASAPFTINPKLVAPTPPIVGSITQPTCAVPTGSVVLNGLPSSGTWTLNPGAIGGSGTTKTISGLAQGTYNYTVTSALSGCTSVVSANIVINAFPLPPVAATTTVTQPTCAVGTGTITVTAPLGAFEYNIDGGAYQSSAIFSGIGVGSHNILVRSTTDNTCISSSASVTVNTAPLPPNSATVIPTHPTCAVATGTIEVAFPLGTGYQYSIDGGSYQASTTFAGVSSGPHSIVVRSTTDNTCISYPTAVTINAQPTPPNAPSANITIQPTCATPTAIIDVTSPVGAYEYKIDNNAFQVSPTFIGVAVGSHNIVVRSTADNTCVSTVTTITVNAPVVPAAATASTTIQPTCAVVTGTVVVTAPTGAYEYNIDGGAWQGSTTFAGVAPGQHSVFVRSYTDGTCVSTATTVFVNAQPSPPATATTSVTQPTCAVATGTVVVTAPTGAYEYNIDGGAYQSSSSFTGVGSGSHIILVRSTADNTCVSPNAIVNISAQPSTPIAATASVTVEPTCASPTGTIMVTAPIGAYEYSIDGGATWQVSTTFNGVTPGSHTILVRRITDTTCVSTSATLVTLNTPTAPAAATVSTTIQPTCDIATGTVVVTSPLGAYEYSIDGGVWQASTTFTGVAPGVHSVLVRRTTDNSCVSTGTNVTVNPQPVSPDNIPDQFVTIYSGQTFTVTPSPVPSGTTYTWSGPTYTNGVYGGAAGSGSNIHGTLSIPSDTGTAIYYVIPNTGPCVGDTFTVTVTVISVMHFVGAITVDNDTVCLGDSIHLNVNVAGGNPPYTYTWTGQGLSSNSVKNPAALPDSEGENIYIVSVTDGAVILSDTISIFVNSLPSITLNYSCASFTATVLPETLTTYEFLLNGIIIQAASATNTNFSTSVVNGDSITVNATDQNGCTAAATIGINCIRGSFPTAFTPDGDGFNDKYPTDDYPLINYELTIFDRWGLTLYTGESGWDGTYKGKLMPPATYYYRLIRTELDGSKTEEIGSVTLVKN